MMQKVVLTGMLLFFCWSELSAQELRGRVVDAESGEGIWNAQVYFIDLATGTNSDTTGHFLFESALPDILKLRVSAFGYTDLTTEIRVSGDTTLVLELNSEHYGELSEVSISTTTGVLQDFSVSNVASASLEKLNVIQSANIVEAISNLPGVYTASLGAGIVKPVIRGLSGLRVVSYYNGLKIENQQWGGDHGLGIGDIGIGRVEVIKGPSSLLYGADALGGVLYLIDEPYADVNSFESFVSSRFETNSMLTTNSAGVKFSGKKLKFNVFGSYRNAADYQLSTGEFVENSRYNGGNFKFATGYATKKWVTNFVYYFDKNRIGVPGHTHDSIIDPSSFLSETRGRSKSVPAQNIINSMALWKNQFFFTNSELKFSLGHGYNLLEEYEEKITIPGISLKNNNFQYRLDYRWQANSNIDLVVGAQGMYQTNANNDGVEEYLIPNSSMLDNGAYAVLMANWNKWNFEAGVRFDNRWLTTSETPTFDQLIEKTYNNISYSFGFSKVFEKMKLRLNLSSGYRAPHVSELLADGIHHGSMKYEVGNPNLKSEHANQVDFSYELNLEDFGLVLNPYFNYMGDYIVLEPTDSTINGYNVYEYQQLESAVLAGFEATLHYHPHFLHGLHIQIDGSYVYGKDNNGNPVTSIPQPRLNSMFIYNFEMESKFKLKSIALQYQYYFKQDRVVENEINSEDYHILNASVDMLWDMKMPLNISVGAKNMLNSAYINHLSNLKDLGIMAPGYNVYIEFKWSLNKNLKK